ncbi:MAG TPA: MarR family transcriptional regulator [Burkholderiaceae bacterium]|nr:MarR family transcriptional regulator [Burkholderiaceae bacterium]
MDNVNQSRSPSRTRPEDELMELVHRVMHQYRSEQYQVLRGGPNDITHMESKVLGYVGRHPGATQSDLARDSGRDKAQLARLIKGLRERGLLAGEADEADRRNVRLALTSEGESVLRLLQQQTRRLATKAVAGIDAAQRAQLVALLRRVSANLAPRE